MPRNLHVVKTGRGPDNVIRKTTQHDSSKVLRLQRKMTMATSKVMRLQRKMATSKVLHLPRKLQRSF